MAADPNHPVQCEVFVEEAYNHAFRYGSAIDAFNDLKAKRQIHTNTDGIPAGALVFTSDPRFDKGYGHVMLSQGDGSYLTANYYSPAHIRVVPLNSNDNQDKFLGWAYARRPPDPISNSDRSALRAHPGSDQLGRDTNEGALRTVMARVGLSVMAVILGSIGLYPLPVAHGEARYNGVMAALWAFDNLDTPPLFPFDDCSYFVSQALKNRYWSYSEEADKWIEFAHPGSRAYLLHNVK
jgi:hypothetical protein